MIAICGGLGPDKEAAAFTQFEPAALEQIVIGGADGVRVDVILPGEGAHAGELVPGGEFLAHDAEEHLADELFANGQLAVPGNPEAHDHHNIQHAR